MNNTNKTSAFNRALALESIPENLRDCDAEDLTRYATTVAYKVFHNLKQGYQMSKDDDPLTVDGIPASEAWPDHYEPAKTPFGE
jgi:hypothetical protein